MESTEQISPRYCPRCNQKTNHRESIRSIAPDRTEVRELCNRCGALTSTEIRGTGSPTPELEETLPKEAEEHLEEELDEDESFMRDPLDGPERPF